jgi:hypothetical protein
VHIVIIYVRYVTLVVSFLGHRLKRTVAFPRKAAGHKRACLAKSA